MITAKIQDMASTATIHLVNNYGEIQTDAWGHDQYEWASRVADRFGLLLVDGKEHLTELNSSFGFELDSESCFRRPKANGL